MKSWRAIIANVLEEHGTKKKKKFDIQKRVAMKFSDRSKL